MVKDKMPDNADVLNRLLAGLAAGDSLGSTTEFCSRDQVLHAYAEHKADGWPWRQVGGGPFGWLRGEPTDDPVGVGNGHSDDVRELLQDDESRELADKLLLKIAEAQSRAALTAATPTLIGQRRGKPR